ncbi:MAG: V-type ATP synthase subunit D [archaeon]
MNDVDVSPTRMELQAVDAKLVLARKGHNMLKKKRDTLITEQLKAKEELDIYRREAGTFGRMCFLSAKLAEMKMGSMAYRNTAYNKSKRIEISMNHKKMVGVKVPVVDARMSDDGGVAYSLIGTPIALDDVVLKMRELSIMAVKLAALEKKVHVLSFEIKKTRRKVNALEKVKIVSLVAADKYIRDYLDEMEREDYSRLKHIKEAMKSESECEGVSECRI